MAADKDKGGKPTSETTPDVPSMDSGVVETGPAEQSPTDAEAIDAAMERIELEEQIERYVEREAELVEQLEGLKAQLAATDGLADQLRDARNEVVELETELARQVRRNVEREAEAPILRQVGQIPQPTGQGMAEFRGKTPGMAVRVLPSHQLGDEASVYAGHRGVVIEIIEEATHQDDGCPFLVDFGDPAREPIGFHFDELDWS